MDNFRQAISTGQLTGGDAAALACAAAEAIRGLNHATRDPRGLGQPSAAYDILGALALAASRLGQAPAQVAAWLDRALAAGLLGHDLGEDPAHAVSAAGIFLGDARRSAAALARDLDAACQHLALINGQPSLHRKDSEQP